MNKKHKTYQQQLTTALICIEAMFTKSLTVLRADEHYSAHLTDCQIVCNLAHEGYRIDRYNRAIKQLERMNRTFDTEERTGMEELNEQVDRNIILIGMGRADECVDLKKEYEKY